MHGVNRNNQDPLTWRNQKCPPAAEHHEHMEVGGFVDHHTHLLKMAARQPSAWGGSTVRELHQRVWRDGTPPMDIGEPAISASAAELADLLRQGLATAAGLGLV